MRIYATLTFLGLFLCLGSLSVQANPASAGRTSSGISYQFGTAEERTEVGAGGTRGTAQSRSQTVASSNSAQLTPESSLSADTDETFLTENSTEQSVAPETPSAVEPTAMTDPLPPEPDLLLEPLTPAETISLESLEGPLPVLDEEEQEIRTQKEADAATGTVQESTSLLLPSQTPDTRPVTEPPSLSPPPLTNLLIYLVLLLVFAGVAYYFFRRGFAGAGFGKGTSRRLQIAEIRSLGNRQFLVVAEYEEVRVLLGVSPGRIDYLRDLPSPEVSVSAETPVFQPPPEMP